MATNLEKVPISDNAAATRNIVGQEFVQGADTMFAQGVIPLQTIVEETTGISLSTSNTDTAISPLANLVVIDFGTNDPTSYIALSGQHRSSGDFNKIDWWPGGPHTDHPGIRSLFGNLTYSPIRLDVVPTALDGHRIVYVPAAGLESIRLATGAGTLTDVRIIQLATPAMPPRPPRPKAFAYATGSLDIGSTTYTAGDAVGTVASMSASNFGPLFEDSGGIIGRLTAGDYAADLEDCDVVIAAADSITAQTDNAAYDFDYPESILAWYEVRASPSGDQIPLRSFGATGGSGFTINDMGIVLPYVSQINTDDLWLFDIFVIARTGSMAGTPTTVYMEAQVEV